MSFVMSFSTKTLKHILLKHWEQSVLILLTFTNGDYFFCEDTFRLMLCLINKPYSTYPPEKRMTGQHCQYGQKCMKNTQTI